MLSEEFLCILFSWIDALQSKTQAVFVISKKSSGIYVGIEMSFLLSTIRLQNMNIEYTLFESYQMCYSSCDYVQQMAHHKCFPIELGQWRRFN